jgi:hypothetical protein
VTPPPRIEFVIDRVVFHGVDRPFAADAARVVTAELEALARGWTDGSLPAPAGRSRAAGRAPAVVAGAGADALGRAVAGAVFDAVTGTEGPR